MPDGYDTVTVTVAGAVETVREFSDAAERDQFIRSVAADAERDGTRTELYILEHSHGRDVERCTCMQFETDHRPEYVFPNVDADRWGPGGPSDVPPAE